MSLTTMRWCATCHAPHGLHAACPVRVEAEAAGDEAVELTEAGRLYSADWPGICHHETGLCAHGATDEEV